MFLYKLLDTSGSVLYVGVTSNVETRMKEHARLRSWWPEVVSVETLQIDDDKALAYEQTTIAMLEPRYNRNHNPNRPAGIDARDDGIGRLVSMHRDSKGMSGRELATCAGISQPYLAQIEAGLRSPSVAVLTALAEALECCPCELLGHDASQTVAS